METTAKGVQISLYDDRWFGIEGSFDAIRLVYPKGCRASTIGPRTARSIATNLVEFARQCEAHEEKPARRSE